MVSNSSSDSRLEKGFHSHPAVLHSAFCLALVTSKSHKICLGAVETFSGQSEKGNLQLQLVSCGRSMTKVRLMLRVKEYGRIVES